MSVGERFATRNFVEASRRKIKLSGAKVVQHAPDTEAILENDWGRIIVEEKTDDYSVETDDFDKMLLMNAAGAKTFTLPAVTGTEIGLPITLVKRGAGKLTVQAGGADRIQDSSAGGTLYNDLAEESFALVRLRVIAAGTWIIEQFTGSGWRTS
jgi:hypothetical protein